MGRNYRSAISVRNYKIRMLKNSIAAMQRRNSPSSAYRNKQIFEMKKEVAVLELQNTRDKGRLAKERIKARNFSKEQKLIVKLIQDYQEAIRSWMFLYITGVKPLDPDLDPQAAEDIQNVLDAIGLIAKLEYRFQRIDREAPKIYMPNTRQEKQIYMTEDERDTDLLIQNAQENNYVEPKSEAALVQAQEHRQQNRIQIQDLTETTDPLLIAFKQASKLREASSNPESIGDSLVNINTLDTDCSTDMLK